LEATSRGERYRLRRYQATNSMHGDRNSRLTVASLSGTPVDQDTVRHLLSGLSPALLTRLYAIDFREPPQVEWLLSEEFARTFQSVAEDRAVAGDQAVGEDHGQRNRKEGLLARRESLARELETRIASERRQSQDLDQHWHQLDSQVHERSQEVLSIQEQLRAVETALLELEAKLRYLQLENQTDRAEIRTRSTHWQPRLEDLDEQITRWRATLADLDAREAQVRSQLAHVHPDDAALAVIQGDQQSWLTIARRLMADLEAEVARLAHASQSRRCVCADAHPRIRPIIETFQRQLEGLEQLSDQRDQAVTMIELQSEADHLSRSRDDLRRQLNHLLDRRQAMLRRAMPRTRDERLEDPRENREHWDQHRTKLEHQRGELCDRLAQAESHLKGLQSQREEVDHCRSGLLSGRSLEEVQRELATVERELQSVSTSGRENWSREAYAQKVTRASDYLAQLTDGKFVRLELTRGGRSARLLHQAGQTEPLESLAEGTRDQVYLSLCLAMISVCRQHGIRLPLILDEPFLRLDKREAAAMATLLADFSKQGHQVLVFTADRETMERWNTLGTRIFDVQRSRHEMQEAAHAPLKEALHVPLKEQEPLKENEPLDSFHLHLDSPIGQFPALGTETETTFLSLDLHTVGDLLEADSEQLALQINRANITASIVRLWQTHVALMCFVPDVSLHDAQVLTSVGIRSLEQFLEIDSETLHHDIEQLLASDRGGRYRQQGFRYDRSRARQWQSGARQHQSRWQNSSRWRRWSRQNQERSQRSSTTPETSTRRRVQATVSQPSNGSFRQSRSSSSLSSSTTSSTRERHRSNGSHGKSSSNGSSNTAWRFYLETSDDVEAAPSIGPKTAERLEKIGILTVADLLEADPIEASRRLDARHIKADTIRAWQQQALLVCEIPQLRGHDAQILVGCGLHQSEKIAEIEPSPLWALVGPFCETKEGERIIRSGKKPDLAEVTDWIAWAQHRQTLQTRRETVAR